MASISAEAVAPTENLTLYQREEYLQALYETLDVVEAGKEEELHAEIQKALTSAVEKRERIIHLIQDEKDRIETAKTRIKGYQAFVKTREAQLDRFEAHVASVIKSMGTDAKGKYPILKGITGQLSLRKSPDSVKLTDEAAVPKRFKTLTLEIGAEEWSAMLESLALDESGPYMPRVKAISIDKTAIKEAIEAGEDVPGADIEYGDVGLVVK